MYYDSVVFAPHVRLKDYFATLGSSYDEALYQIYSMASCPFINRIAVMGDFHAGKGCAVGVAIAAHNAIIPGAIGVDIGCGMAAVKTNLKESTIRPLLSQIRSNIEARVPVGFRLRESDISDHEITKKLIKLIKQFSSLDSKINPDLIAPSLGTLGGGNHFIEIRHDREGDVWVMVHTGSRKLGHEVGTRAVTKAKELMRLYWSMVSNNDCAFLAANTKEFNDYWAQMTIAQEFAKLNREAILSEIYLSIAEEILEVQYEETFYDCHHNYTSIENLSYSHENRYVMRKGSVSNRKGHAIILPGSMGTMSYIAEGNGDPHLLDSCAHGSGRLMSRGQAKKTITLKKHLEDIAHIEARKDEGLIDESPSAYRDIQSVLHYHKDAINIKYELHPMLCVKG